MHTLKFSVQAEILALANMPSKIGEPLPGLSLACAAEVDIGCGSTPPLLYIVRAKNLRHSPLLLQA